MTIESSEKTTSRHRILVEIGIVFISLVVPLAVIIWSVIVEMRDKGVAFQPSKTSTYFHGTAINGELWYPELTAANSFAGTPTASRLLRLNLETGEERVSELEIPTEYGWPLWINNTLYYRTLTAIYQQSGNSFTKLADLPPSPPNYDAAVFLDGGRLTTFRPIEGERFRLMHLVEGHWIDGRAILLPGSNRSWQQDEEQNRAVLRARSSQAPGSYSIQVISDEGHPHLFVTSYGSLAAYRRGFEYIDEETSALSPENTPPELTGWEPIGSTPTNQECWLSFGKTSEGILFLNWNPANITRKNPDGTWNESSFRLDDVRGFPSLVIDNSSEKSAYILCVDQQWSSASIARIEGLSVKLPHAFVPGSEREYLDRWKRIGIATFLAWLLHLAIAFIGTAWHSRDSGEYQFGHQHVRLAPIWRRVPAAFIDLTVLLTATVFLGLTIFSEVVFQLPTLAVHDMAQGLFFIEQVLLETILVTPGGFFGSPGIGEFVSETIQIVMNHPDRIFVFFLGFVVLIGAFTLIEGRYGVTPGKYLLGLQTKQTSLRPCGIGRSFIRLLFHAIDFPSYLTPLPAVLSMTYSGTRQRWGDRVADTIVITNKQIEARKSLT